MAIDQFLKPLFINNQTLQSLALDLRDTYQDLALNSTDQFLATPVNVLPSGTEKANVLAIDVGGTNLRVGFVDLLGDAMLERSFDRSWPIGDHFKMEKAGDLFAWIGDCIADVVTSCIVHRTITGRDPYPVHDVIPLGITWSFPLIQTSMAEANILPMGKGYSITSEVSLNQLLLAGYERHTHPGPSSGGLPCIKIEAITNDTLATFAALSYTTRSTPNRRVAMALIVGTGVNAAIPMRIRALHQSKQNHMELPAGPDSRDQTIMVNTEWGIKGTAAPLVKHGIMTGWDLELDQGCEAPGYMPFEYMTGGRYLGELVRIVACRYLIVEEGWDVQDLPVALTLRNGLDTSTLSSIFRSDIMEDEVIVRLTQALPPPLESTWSWSCDRVQVLQHIAQAVQLRSSQMVAAAVVAGLACSGELMMQDTKNGHDATKFREDAQCELIVAFTGGVISQYPSYIKDCQETIDALVTSLSSSRRSVALEEVLNGGVTGAGALAGTVWNLPTGGHKA